MNSKEAIAKIKQLLFGAETFGYLKTKDGVEMQIEGEVELEKEIYIITPDGNIPAEEGDYEMEDGLKVKVKEGLIDAIDYAGAEHEDEEEMETEEEVEIEAEAEVTEDEVKMVSAELIDGTIVETDTEELKVGDALFVVTEEGRVAAPDGNHETTDGLVVTVEDGIVKEIETKVVEEEVELSTETTEGIDELLEVFTEGFTKLNNELNVIREEYTKLSESFNKFSAEPAGERQYFNTADYAKTLKAEKINKLQALRGIKNK
jgi:hypothetical protein